MAFSGTEPPPRVTGTAAVPGGRYAGPMEAPLEEATPRHRSSRRTFLRAVITVVVVAVVGAGTYIATRPAATSTSGQPTAGQPAPAPGGSLGSSHKPSPDSTPSLDASPASGQALHIGDLPGWHQVFYDDFSGTSLDDRWFSYDGQPGGDPGGWFSSKHVSVGNGMLTISGYKEQTPNGNIYTTGGVSNQGSFSQTYGRFDVRFRMDKGVGIIYALLLWPTNNVWPPEIDIVEDNGSDRTWTTATVHWGTANHTIERRIYHQDFTKWHTASVEWTKGHLVYKLDGQTWGTVDNAGVPSQPMNLALQSQAYNCGGAFEKCPNSTTPATVNLQIDWVSIYQSTSQ